MTAPEVIEIRSEENHEKQFTGLWHSDISWSESPSHGIIALRGGRARFWRRHAVCQTCIRPTTACLRACKLYCRDCARNIGSIDTIVLMPHTPRFRKTGSLHPVITTHPETGRKVLFVNEYFTTRFADMTEQESEPLLQYLFQHAVRPDFTCRIRWQPGTLVFWDNRCTLHYATNDYPGQRRLMHRVTIDGAPPA